MAVDMDRNMRGFDAGFNLRRRDWIEAARHCSAVLGQAKSLSERDSSEMNQRIDFAFKAPTTYRCVNCGSVQ